MSKATKQQPAMSILTNEYAEAVNRPANIVHDLRLFHNQNETEEANGPFTCFEVPLLGEGSLAASEGAEDGFIISSVLSDKECDELVKISEANGIVPPSKHSWTLRTAKRTDNFVNVDLSELIVTRIGPILRSRMREDASFGPFHDLHHNWRVLRYDPGDVFPAHQDQMDSIQRLDKSTGKKDFIVSSHTLLINLSRDGVRGGATRFYPQCKVRARSSGQYDYAIDVCIPRGWALVFPQVGMVHAGQPVLQGSSVPKYIAQTGILRLLPRDKLIKPSVFRLGPGLQPY